MVSVRLATEKDADDLFALNSEFGNDAEKRMIAESVAESLSSDSREIICVAFVDGETAGFCAGHFVKSMCYAASRVDVEALYVKEKFRRRGVGRGLLAFLESEAAKRGIRHMHISTDAGNAPALSLYTSGGYAVTGPLLEKDLNISTAVLKDGVDALFSKGSEQ